MPGLYDDLPDSDAVLAQFNRLMSELLRGNMSRNTFRPWEVEVLLDIEACNLKEAAKRETLSVIRRLCSATWKRAPAYLSSFRNTWKP